MLQNDSILDSGSEMDEGEALIISMTVFKNYLGVLQSIPKMTKPLHYLKTNYARFILFR